MIRIGATTALLGVGAFYGFYVSAAPAPEGVISQSEPIVQTPAPFSESLLYAAHAVAPQMSDNEVFAGTGGATAQPSLASVGGTAVLAASPPLTTASSSNNRTRATTYTVKEGDIPSVIAASFGITTNTLLWTNDLSEGEYIRPGDTLTILATSGIVHTVRSGDTISSLALQYKASAPEIIAYNGLSRNGFIRAGQKLVVPDGELPIDVRSYAAASSYSGQTIDDYFIRPSAGRISQGLHATNAVDIAESCWTPIYAAADGRVTIADGYGWNGGYGKYVRMRHPNGVETVYAHAIQVVVSAGQNLGQGDLIAYMGSTGRSTGCHLHWEVWGAKNPLR